MRRRAGVENRERGSGFREGAACGAYLSGKNTQNFERERRIAEHQIGEAFTAHEAEFRAFRGFSCEGVRLIADKSGQAEQRSRGNMRADDFLAGQRSHTQGGGARAKNIEAVGQISLVEEDAIRVAGNQGRSRFERFQQLLVGYEGRGIELQGQTPSASKWETGA